MRFIVAMVAALIGVGVLMPPTAAAGPTVCDYPACTPGIAPNMVLGAPCDNTTYYAFGVSGGYVPATQPGRLMFCGSPRRYQPRWFRSPPMAGIKEENADCHVFMNYVAQAPDGLFLICIAEEGHIILDPRRYLSYCVTKALRGMVSGRSTEPSGRDSAATTEGTAWVRGSPRERPQPATVRSQSRCYVIIDSDKSR